MGILFNASSIVLGGLLGSAFKARLSFKNFDVFGISIMIISLAGFFENIFGIREISLTSDGIMLLVMSLILGSMAGEALHIEERLSRFASREKAQHNAVIDASLFFGVGGLQICGPILLAVNGDSSQLFLKSVVDFPFALMFGAAYGRSAALSAGPVALMQLLIAVAAYFAGAFLSDAVIKQLCAMGYIILFFSGYNLIREEKHKINNVNMIPGIFVILLFHVISGVWGMLS